VLLDEMTNTKPVPGGGETDLAGVLNDLAPKLKRRGMVILISDCFGDAASLLRALARFRHARHDVIVFQVWDRDELEFNFRGWTRFDSLEQPAVQHKLDPQLIRDRYLQNLAAFRAALAEGCARERIDLVPLVTDQPYADALASYLSLRKKRR